MITEDYVSFEIAKLLKEKGFDVPDYYCSRVYSDKGTLQGVDSVRFKGVKYISAPTLQMAMKWLRKVHGITIIPNLRVPDPITGTIDCYCAGVWHVPKNNGGALCFTSPTPYEGYSSYEEACEEAIKYCLENLI